MKRLVSGAALLAISAGVFATPAAMAEGEFSANVALTTDYVWRGISQNNENPAISGGFDYANGLFYAGTWASNVATDGTMELDFYGGIAGETDSGLAWDVGVITYIYPDTDDLDFTEVYGGLGYEFAGGFGVGGYVYYDFDNESTYVEGTASYGFTDELSVDASLGNYSFEGGGDYTNWSIGGTYAFDVVDVDLRYWDTDVDGVAPVADERIVLTFSKGFP